MGNDRVADVSAQASGEASGSPRGVVLLSAGGTGGHLFPAQSLAEELVRRGWAVDLATDERADKYGARFPARLVHIIASETVRSRSPLALLKTALALGRGFLQSLAVIRRIRPAVVVGFGGYPTVPPMMAALFLRRPTILHEQNAVMGRANARLAPKATRIATSFTDVSMPEVAKPKVVLTGNPVRGTVLAAADTPYRPIERAGEIRLLVFGGSQGARYFSDVMPPAIASLDVALRHRIRLTQQVRAEDMDRVQAAYAGLGLEVELAPFFVDMPARIASSHLVVCRSGASTVTELAVIGRPALMVPFPGALDQDQAGNARVLSAAGGGWTFAQKDLTPGILAAELTRLMLHPEALSDAAAAARTAGRPDAVSNLADLVESLAGPRR